VHWIAGRWRVFKDEHGRPVRVLGMDFDITERKQAEEALRTSEERLRVALKNAPIKVFNQDRELRYTWVHNLSGGWAETDFLGKTDEEIFEPETAARMKTLKQAVLETGEGKREVLTLTAHGEISHCDVTIEPLRDAAGKVVGVNSACMDVTHLQQVTEDLRQATEKLAEEKCYLEQEIDTELGFKEIVGRSAALKEVMEQVGKVAASDATVLLLGETGTGKELVARALHRLSRRAGNSFIKMNCAAIPSGLLESELFGYEKGAFTGAVGKKLGRLELADKGTLFLDEIGEIPLALQPKLLRVLQDQEFERLGGTQTLKVDFRLIAATKRDLAESVKKKEFRSDLYYRLNVFPVRVPPLRERREDIRLLVEHFAQKFAKRMNRKITSIPKKTIDALTGWDWPGNVRELENFVERSVILTQGSVLVSPLSELKPPSEGAMNDTLEAAEREHILRALRESRGQIGGTRGAAARLGLKRTTLQSKLKQMGVDRRPPAAGH
jgi:formate hydrogenlyase transcriptional activator